MARPKPVTFDKLKIVAENRRARFDYYIEDTFEAGLALQGTEVKALRAGEASIAESYAEVKDGQVWLINANIPEYSHGNRLNHEPRRPRKLLLHEREIEKFVGAVERKGMILMLRPKQITDMVRQADARRARDQIRAKEAQLSSAPDGQFTRDHAQIKPKINKGYEPMPIPQD